MKEPLRLFFLSMVFVGLAQVQTHPRCIGVVPVEDMTHSQVVHARRSIAERHLLHLECLEVRQAMMSLRSVFRGLDLLLRHWALTGY
jgi:hypothetical protein